MPRATVVQLGGANRAAFLDMVAFSEIGAQLLAKTDDGYNVLVGATPAAPRTFSSYATHPNILNTALKSTAAGRYQLLYRWYAPYCRLLHLTDFSPLSQDLIALQQVRERRALPMVDAGQFEQAVAACAGIWASLPGNSYGQHQNQMAALRAAYLAAGGTLQTP